MINQASNASQGQEEIFEIYVRNGCEDVVRRRRTVAHLRVVDPAGTIGVEVGGRLRVTAKAHRAGSSERLSPSAWFFCKWFFCAEVTVVEVQVGRLSTFVDADLEGLCADSREAYLRRWDAVHPAALAATDPDVVRLVWRYDELPPEFAIETAQ